MALTHSRAVTISRLLQLAEEGIEKKDRDQACDNGWAALALRLDEIAERRGMKHGTMREYYLIMDALEEEAEDPEETGLSFTCAASLHYRWFRYDEDWEFIREELDAVKELLAWLEDVE